MNNCCTNPIALSCRRECGCYQIPLDLPDGSYVIYNHTTGKRTPVTIGEGQGLSVVDAFLTNGQNIIQIFDSLGAAVEMDFTDILGNQETANAFIIDSKLFYTVNDCIPDACDNCSTDHQASLLSGAVVNIPAWQSFLIEFELGACCEGLRFAGFEDAAFPYTCQKLSATQFYFERKLDGDDSLSFYAKFETTNSIDCNFVYSVLINIIP